MPGKKTLRFTLRDYVSLIVALSLAFAVWLIHNLSHKYSEVVQCEIVAVSDIDGRARMADRPAKLVARCEMEGFSILYYKLVPDAEVKVTFNKNELVALGGSRFCVPAVNLLSHTHDIFGDNARCEYFVTDTLFFDFQEVDYKIVPVVLVKRIEFEPQYMLKSPIAVSPDSVMVYGPSEQLADIKYVNTRPLVLNGLHSDTAGELQLEVPEGMTFNTDMVDYHVSVSRYVEEVVTVPVVARGVPAGKELQVSPSVAKVTVRSAFPKESASNDGLKVVVDYSDFEKSISGKCFGQTVNLPKGILSSHVNPEIFDCVEIANM